MINHKKIDERIEQLEEDNKWLTHRLEMADMDGVDDPDASERYHDNLSTIRALHEKLNVNLSELNSRSYELKIQTEEHPIASNDQLELDNNLEELALPKYAGWFVRLVNSPAQTEAMLGDFSENYEYDRQNFGEGFAR